MQNISQMGGVVNKNFGFRRIFFVSLPVRDAPISRFNTVGKPLPTNSLRSPFECTEINFV
jgi:hypothetical protein